MLKKLLAMASALMIAASFAGCGSSDSDDDSSSKKADAASSVKEEESKDEESSEEKGDTESEEENGSEAEPQEEPEEPEEPSASAGGSANEDEIKENIAFDIAAIISFNDGSEFDTEWSAGRNDDGDVIQFHLVVDSQMMKDALDKAGKTVEDIEYVNFGIATECPESLLGGDIYYIEYDVKYDVSFEADGGDTQMSIGSGDYMTYYPRLNEKETFYGMPMYVDDVDAIDKLETMFTIDISNLALTSFSF